MYLERMGPAQAIRAAPVFLLLVGPTALRDDHGAGGPCLGPWWALAGLGSLMRSLVGTLACVYGTVSVAMLLQLCLPECLSNARGSTL